MIKTVLKVSLGILFAFCAYPFVDNAYKWNACVREFKSLEQHWESLVGPLGVTICNGGEVDMFRVMPKK